MTQELDRYGAWGVEYLKETNTLGELIEQLWALDMLEQAYRYQEYIQYCPLCRIRADKGFSCRGCVWKLESDENCPCTDVMEDLSAYRRGVTKMSAWELRDRMDYMQKQRQVLKAAVKEVYFEQSFTVVK